jgi:NAD(P)-dependent dehydrogenase (short-subunit alcohol dehydrogenase family)
MNHTRDTYHCFSTSLDLAPHSIRVNAISPALIGPGYMWSRQNELHASSGSPYFPSEPSEVAKAKIARCVASFLKVFNFLQIVHS